MQVTRYPAFGGFLQGSRAGGVKRVAGAMMEGELSRSADLLGQ